MMRLMKEFFSGSGIMSKTFKEAGYDTVTIDNDPRCNADIPADILTIDDNQKGQVMWFSIPCTTFSVASIGTHWKGDYEPKTEACKRGLELLEKSIRIIAVSKPKDWFIENPRGVMRKVIDRLFVKYGLQNLNNQVIRHTITFCQYGENRQKMTDIWTNNPHWKPRPKCKNGSKCHEAAPRGSKTGTQGLKDAFERGKLPKELCEEIVKACENK